jgi:quercetin dioxygenase-like cupin family protein
VPRSGVYGPYSLRLDVDTKWSGGKMKTTLGLLFAALLAAVQPVCAQDPVTISPKMYTVLLDNDQVRVLEFRAKAGEKEPMHSHPAMVVYSFTSNKLRLQTPDGKSEEREAKAGTSIWSDPVTHAYENLGPAEAYVLLIEMKGHGPAKKGPKQ